MTDAKVVECTFCGAKKSARGIQAHEIFCDENPNPGISPEKQDELGLFDDETEAEPDGEPNPHQRESAEPSGGLPSVSTLEPSKKPGAEVSTDGGQDTAPSECPVCGHGEVSDAGAAKQEYIEAERDRGQNPDGRVVFALELADWACENMDCAACWGAKYSEPVPMEEVLEA